MKRSSTGKIPSSKRQVASQSSRFTKESLQSLESKILESPSNYNDLVKLQHELDQNAKGNQVEQYEQVILLSNTLFRILGKLMKNGSLTSSKQNSEPQAKVIRWLLDRYRLFCQSLLSILGGSYDDQSCQITALTILMKLLKLESQYLGPKSNEFHYPKQLFCHIITTLLENSDPSSGTDSVLSSFAETYLNTYDDIRYHFYLETVEIVEKTKEHTKTAARTRGVATHMLDLLIATTHFPESSDDIQNFWLAKPKSRESAGARSGSVLKLSSHKLAFQKCWLATLSLPLTFDQYRMVLMILHKRLLPYMIQPPLLMDFLTDAYNSGGPVALLALNGLFSLMQKYNLDYSNFYEKLYALFDSSIMNVKYRSRFFRLLDLFLSSSHLPATITASFIKRMARLALFAPPSAIVATIPFIYNQLKRHPTCMVMIHRVDQTNEFSDPYDNNQLDPLLTQAINSSLWELETLQSHYHPNVATLARIMSEQFRKPQYILDDFLDHSYSSLMNAEQKRRIKNIPALEFDKFDNLFKGDGEQVSVYISDWRF